MWQDSPTVQKLWLTALLLFPFVLWLLPAGYFDKGTSICPSLFLFDIECFGCGITRAIMYLHHLDIEEAVYYNQFVLFVYPALVLIWFYWVKTAYRHIKNINT